MHSEEKVGKKKRRIEVTKYVRRSGHEIGSDKS